MRKSNRYIVQQNSSGFTSQQSPEENIIDLIVKSTLKKHNVQPNRNLSSKDKQALRGMFNRLQSQVNDFLASQNVESPINSNKKGNSSR